MPVPSDSDAVAAALNVIAEGDTDGGVAQLHDLAERGVGQAMTVLGRLMAEFGALEQARSWWSQGAAVGDPEAMTRLALLEPQDYGLLIRAAEAGYAPAMIALGGRAEQDGDESAALSWLERAVEAGDPHAANDLGVRREQAGDLASARDLYETSALAGSTVGMYNLGHLLLRQRQFEAAKPWLEFAAEAGDPDAAADLAELAFAAEDTTIGLEYLTLAGDCAIAAGDLAAAERHYRRAADRGHASAMNSLGLLAKNEDRPEVARAWFEAAIAHGEVAAATANLGALADAQGHAEEATTLLTRAAALGVLAARVNLGHIALRAGDPAGASEHYQLAASTDYAPAWTALGLLAATEGNPERARMCWESAAELDDPDAMLALADLAEETGDAEGAFDWRQRATLAGARTPD